MRIIIILSFFIFTQNALAQSSANAAAQSSAIVTPPSLGDCSEYSDYYIYKCQPFKCKLPIAKLVRTTLMMEVVGTEEGLCQYKYQYIIRNPKIPPSEIKMKCSLSERGKLEMANQFTAYKKGNIGIYINPPVNETLNKECHRY